MKKELDLYIDESGDFGFNGDASKYYILSFIFHDTKTDLTSKVNVINSKLKDYMMNNDYFHAGPLIRGENNFRFYSITERKRIFQSFFMFFCSLNISTQSFVFCKKI